MSGIIFLCKYMNLRCTHLSNVDVTENKPKYNRILFDLQFEVNCYWRKPIVTTGSLYSAFCAHWAAMFPIKAFGNRQWFCQSADSATSFPKIYLVVTLQYIRKVTKHYLYVGVHKTQLLVFNSICIIPKFH